ncbi:hypothetical protein HZA97_08690 [Candidatus Woesearchaeota archaeon]|nr:hypothetical protein [Candidatus Woesearchaeota archaeon]
MEFQKGSKVVTVRNLGPENYNDRGTEEHYYYRDAYNIHQTPLKSKGVVTRVEGAIVWVKIDDKGQEYRFRHNELDILQAEKTNLNLNNFKPLPSYVFDLASKMPVFILNDRLYILGEAQENLKENFFQTTEKRKKTVHGIVESGSLKSLEELAESHFSEEFEKFQNKYIQEVIKEKEESSERKENYKIVDFIINKVFPYLRTASGDNSKINELFGVKETEKEIQKESELKNEDQNKNEDFISQIIANIENEKFSENKKKKKKQKVKKLDLILGYDPDLEVDRRDLPKNYSFESLLGKVLNGRNVAIINNTVYHLTKSSKAKKSQVLNFSGTDYFLVTPMPVQELKNKCYFELSKKVRIKTLKTKAANDKKIRDLLENNSNLESLVNKKEHWEEDFGFIKEDGSYSVFLQVPKHVLKMPEDYKFYYEYPDDYNHEAKKNNRNRYYQFEEVRVAVQLFIEQGKIKYNHPITIESYSHPFAYTNRSICLGQYNYYELNHLESGLAVATLLKDTKRTLLSGYKSGETKPVNPLEKFGHRKISLDEVKKRNLPITNINLRGKK